ncbi:MAG: helix-turn-helix transcriptional regulator [Opitutaceae bacterium]|jgi:transcriptional regulator with XRE-family HTH domain|nr:helix-turn-helix transcriptional regulator [Opitutaceae bacterium]
MLFLKNSHGMRLTQKNISYCEILGLELRRRREAAGLSLNRLAEMAGLSQPMVGFIEKGQSTPMVASLFRIAEALGVPLGEIIPAVDAAFAKLGKRIPRPPMTRPAKC